MVTDVSGYRRVAFVHSETILQFFAHFHQEVEQDTGFAWCVLVFLVKSYQKKHMPDVIRLLPDLVANQIAAGEVIQRPSSVVKECIENALDASSSCVKVIFKEAGKSLVQVVDDGKGMSASDAKMSLIKHSTSKIYAAEDLFKIQTMGFRGEAMASMVSVAQLELETRPADCALGIRLWAEGTSIQKHEPFATAVGTKVSVKNLFFNVPARRHFLKSNSVETKHIIEEFQRAALSRPDVAFSLYQDATELHQLPAAKLSHRIVHLFGNNYKEQLIACKASTDHMVLRGYIGKPSHAKKTRGEQFFFVNKRFVKLPYIHHAIRTAFADLIRDNSFPFYVLCIEIHPSQIDVNIHPAKTEVKFKNEKAVYAIVSSAVQQALATHQITPSLDFAQDINFDPFSLSATHEARPPLWQNVSARLTSTDWSRPTAEGWRMLFPAEHTERSVAHTTTIPSASNDPQTAVADNLLHHRPKIQLQDCYILAPMRSGLIIVDQQAAHERILYEQYMHYLNHGQGPSHPLTTPVQVVLSSEALHLFKDAKNKVQSLGFVLDFLDAEVLLVSGCPLTAIDHSPQVLLEALCKQYSASVCWAQSLAHCLRMLPKRLPTQEMDTLIDQLFACKEPMHTPAGHKTFVLIRSDYIAKMFAD